MRDIILEGVRYAVLAGGAYAIYNHTKFSRDLYNTLSFKNDAQTPEMRKNHRAHFEKSSGFAGLFNLTAWRFWMMRQDEKWQQPVFNTILTYFPALYSVASFLTKGPFIILTSLFSCAPIAASVYMTPIWRHILPIGAALLESSDLRFLLYVSWPVILCNALQFAPALEYCVGIREKVLKVADATLGQIGEPDSKATTQVIVKRIGNTDIKASELSYLNKERDNLHKALEENRKNQETRISSFKHFFDYSRIIERITNYERALGRS